MATASPSRKALARSLARHLEFASEALDVFDQLCYSISKKRPLTQIADDFVWVAVRALREAAIANLFRVYDTQKHAASIRALMALEPGHPQLAEDKKWLNTSPAVRQLLRLRHEAVGHVSAGASKIGVDDFINRFPVTRDEFQTLVTRAHRLIVRYSGERVFMQIPVLQGNARVQLGDVEILLEQVVRAPATAKNRHPANGLPSN
jgi:hypothetical protein